MLSPKGSHLRLVANFLGLGQLPTLPPTWSGWNFTGYDYDHVGEDGVGDDHNDHDRHGLYDEWLGSA